LTTIGTKLLHIRTRVASSGVVHVVNSRKASRSSVNRIRAYVGPLWPYLVLTAIPAVGFIAPDVAGGHLLLSGDNVQQNYPLHVLVGTMLRHGQLPYWNQYIFSGSPLLADFNAGAFYPLMGLFVILPDRIAWMVTEAALFAAIAIGMYAFLRAMKLSTMACFLAGATFAFSGAVLSQVNHVDMTEGFVAIPWMLLAVLHIIRDGRWRWSILLGVGFATAILGGAPEAMLDGAILIVVYAALSAGFDRRRWWFVLTRGGAGAALALALAAIQWLPGLNAIANSQRSGFGGGFASTGSYPPAFGFLSIVPYIDGGYQHLGEAGFFSHYNLPEVGIYVGILPLVALVALLHPRWPSRLPARERLIWYVIGVVGALLALGANTPLEHLFNAIPLYGHQRLQSRNMVDVSAALSVLFAGWLDRAPETRASWVTYDRLTALVPLGVVGGLTIWAFTDPTSMLRELARVSSRPLFVHTVREATVIALVICLTAAMIVWLRSRVPVRWWMGVAAAFVAVDIGLMALTSQLATFPSNTVLAGTTQVEQLVAAHLSPGGRFDVYDPQGYASPTHANTGVPDLNILAGLPSVAGYASIVNGNYSNVTQTHTLAELNISQLRHGALDGLDLQDIVTLPEYFLLPVAGVPTMVSNVQQLPERQGNDPVLPLGNGPNFNDTAYPFYPAARPALQSGQTGRWFYGESIDPTTATILFHATSAAAHIRLGKVRHSGVTTWGPEVPVGIGSTKVSGALPAGNAVGLAFEVVAGHIPAHQAFVTVATRTFELDGSLSGALRPGVWRQQGIAEGYTLFQRVQPPHPITASSSGGSATPVKVVSSNTKIETVSLQAAVPLTVVRDVAWDPGWRASVSVNGGSPRAIAVGHHGLVEQVNVPPGLDVVTFRYRPPHIVVATILSVGATVGLLALFVMTLVRLRHRRRWATAVNS
jgi:hypothetical protein